VSASRGPRPRGLLLRRVEVRLGVLGDVRVRDARIAEIGTALAGRGEQVVDGAGRPSWLVSHLWPGTLVTIAWAPIERRSCSPGW
jgi:hypothetical protein